MFLSDASDDGFPAWNTWLTQAIAGTNAANSIARMLCDQTYPKSLKPAFYMVYKSIYHLWKYIGCINLVYIYICVCVCVICVYIYIPMPYIYICHIYAIYRWDMNDFVFYTCIMHHMSYHVLSCCPFNDGRLWPVRMHLEARQLVALGRRCLMHQAWRNGELSKRSLDI